MIVSGFTFVRNAIKYDYPIVEAIQSILPLCNEVVIAVGKSTDETLELIKSIPSNKIKIIETVWDEAIREGGKVLALETNKAFRAIRKDADWAFYIQGDEILHEKDLPTVQAAMQKYKHQKNIDGLLFKYNHFYGSYDYIGDEASWYPHEIRIIKNNKDIYSYRDAQGFRKGNNQKLNVIPIEAYIHHYGWVKHPQAMQAKQQTFQKLWHNDAEAARRSGSDTSYQYEKIKEQLIPFRGTHPSLIIPRINKQNWNFNYIPNQNKPSIKVLLKKYLKKYLGLDFSYKNYIIAQ